MAMLPFCGYHMGRLFSALDQHATLTERDSSRVPCQLVPQGCRRKIPVARLWRHASFLKWIVDRARGRALAKETPLGWQPSYEDIDWSGLDFLKEQLESCSALITHPGVEKCSSTRNFFSTCATTFPKNSCASENCLFVGWEGRRRQIGSFACFSKRGKGEPFVQKPEWRNSRRRG